MASEDDPFLPEDDAYHEPSDDEHLTETNWWCFNVPDDGAVGCTPPATRIAKR